jgi:glycosyltransferase involved in cell wall biosynthesis
LIGRFGSAAIAIDDDVAGTYRLRIPVEVIPNPVAVEPGAAADLGIPSGRMTVGYFGYLRRQKGWPQFLRALRRLVDDGVQVQGVIVGGGVRPTEAFHGLRGRALKAVGVPDEEGDLERAIDELGLRDHVTRLPFTNRVGPVLRALDVVVFPNQGAGLGRPVLEAAAYGVPVVASGSTHGGGFVEPNVTALLTGPGEGELAASLAQLLRDPARRARLGSEAARSATAFAPPLVARRVEEVWTRLLDERQAAAR